MLNNTIPPATGYLAISTEIQNTIAIAIIAIIIDTNIFKTVFIVSTSNHHPSYKLSRKMYLLFPLSDSWHNLLQTALTSPK